MSIDGSSFYNLPEILQVRVYRRTKDDETGEVRIDVRIGFDLWGK